MESEIIVRGEGQARALPDRATIHVTVEGEAAGRDEAYGQTARLANAVDAVVGTYAAAIDRAATAGLVVHPKTRWKKGESHRSGWRATRTTILEVVDFTCLGDLVAELATAGGAISGPCWQLDPTNPVHGEARRLAASDARRRASEYAEALGLEVHAVAWVVEPGLRRDTDLRFGLAAAGDFTRAGAGAEDIMEVTPDELTVAAAVEVGFTFVDPSLRQ